MSSSKNRRPSRLSLLKKVIPKNGPVAVVLNQNINIKISTYTQIYI